ncbi:hypothetical protein SSS_05341 [Sarcoptes scabiei]|uniref:Uncharacterized protein n=1 Tax=Sarcoptes scabiei TaxID=52283 RepID=A0A834R6Y3_SARSC|nr:hypothetical protein SSS_05341 [Sarcoptes scabiei]
MSISRCYRQKFFKLNLEQIDPNRSLWIRTNDFENESRKKDDSANDAAKNRRKLCGLRSSNDRRCFTIRLTSNLNHLSKYFYNQSIMKYRQLIASIGSQNRWNGKNEQRKNQKSFRENLNDPVNLCWLETFGFIGTALLICKDVRIWLNQWNGSINQRELCPSIASNRNTLSNNFDLNAFRFDGFECSKSSVVFDNNSNDLGVCLCGGCNLCNLFTTKLSKYFKEFFVLNQHLNIFRNHQTIDLINLRESISLNGQSAPIPETHLLNLDDNLPTTENTDQSDSQRRSTEELWRNFDNESLILSSILTTQIGLRENPVKQTKLEKDASEGKLQQLPLEHYSPPSTSIIDNNLGDSKVNNEQLYKSTSSHNSNHSYKLRSPLIDALFASKNTAEEYKESWSDSSSPNESSHYFQSSWYEQSVSRNEDRLNNQVGVDLMANRNPVEAMKRWSGCKSSPAALFNIGVAYESGRQSMKAKPDMDLAFCYYLLASMKGHRYAIFNLSLFYLYGKGKIEQNIENGIKLLQLAADKGVEDAIDYCKLFDQQTKSMNAKSLQSELFRSNSRDCDDDSANYPSKLEQILFETLPIFKNQFLNQKESLKTSTVTIGRKLKRSHSQPNLNSLI